MSSDNRSRRDSGKTSERAGPRERSSLVEAFLERTGKVAGGTLDLALDVAAMAAMSGDGWLRNVVSSSASPERLQAMADAGHFLRDARETAGLSIRELSERLELGDESVLEGVERGDTILPLELMLRAASLLARHDPVPFLIKFLRSYNPQLEATLEQWGVMALPRNFERERRFINLYRQHDFLRDLSDDEFARFVDYMDSSTSLVVEVMERERAANAPRRRAAAKRSPSARRRASSTARAKKTASKNSTANADDSSGRSAVRKKPVVRKVKPRPRRSNPGQAGS